MLKSLGSEIPGSPRPASCQKFLSLTKQRKSKDPDIDGETQSLVFHIRSYEN